MKRTLKATLVFIVLAAVILLSVSATLCHCHECLGEGCRICAFINFASRTLCNPACEASLFAIAGTMLVMFVFNLTLSFRSESATLVGMHTEMNS